MLSKLRHYLRYFRLKPYDTSTEEGRRHERYRRIAVSSVASVGARVAGMGIHLVTIPLLVGYLGEQRFGMYMTIAGTVMMLRFADLGLANGLVNALSESIGRDDWREGRRDIATTLLGSVLIVLALLAVFAASYPFVSWADVFNVDDPLARQEAGPAVAVFLVAFLATVVGKVFRQTNLALQREYVNGMWETLGHVGALAFLLLGIHLEAGLPWLVLALMGAPAVAWLVNGVMIFTFQYPRLRPRFKDVNRASLKKMGGLGSQFLFIQIGVALGLTSDNYILAQVLGPAAVGVYAVAWRLYSVAPQLLTQILLPLWPAYGESLVRGDRAWGRSMMRKSIVVGLLVNGVPALLLLAVGRPLVRIWAGEVVVPPIELLVGLSLYLLVTGVNQPLMQMIKGYNQLKLLMVIISLMVVAKIAIAIPLSAAIGVSGVVFATVIAQFVFTLIPLAWKVRGMLGEASSST